MCTNQNNFCSPELNKPLLPLFDCDRKTFSSDEMIQWNTEVTGECT